MSPVGRYSDRFSLEERVMNAPIASSMRREGSFIHEWHPEDQERIGHRVDIAGNWVLISIVPVIFRTLHERLLASADEPGKVAAMRQAGIESAALIGFSSAIGAYGGFFIPKSYGSSITMTGGPEMALYGFIAFYLSCLVITWWWYFQRGTQAPC
jgi:hypothetical protein